MKAYKIVLCICMAAIIGASIRLVVAMDFENPADEGMFNSIEETGENPADITEGPSDDVQEPGGILAQAMQDLDKLYRKYSEEMAKTTLNPTEKTYFDSFNNYLLDTDILLTGFSNAADDITQDTVARVKELIYQNLSAYNARTISIELEKLFRSLLNNMKDIYLSYLNEIRRQLIDAPIVKYGETTYSLRELSKKELRSAVGEPIYRQIKEDPYTTGDRMKDTALSLWHNFKNSYKEAVGDIYTKSIKDGTRIIKKKIAEEDARFQRQLRRDLGLFDFDGVKYYRLPSGRIVKGGGSAGYDD